MLNNNHRSLREERDELRAKFTSWLEVILTNAQKKYIKASARRIETVPLDDEMLFYVEDPQNPFDCIEISENDFDFQEVRLATAFQELPLMRKEILRLMFVEELTTSEIAARLNISEAYVRQQKSRAFRKLRSALDEGDDGDD